MSHVAGAGLLHIPCLGDAKPEKPDDGSEPRRSVRREHCPSCHWRLVMAVEKRYAGGTEQAGQVAMSISRLEEGRVERKKGRRLEIEPML